MLGWYQDDPRMLNIDTATILNEPCQRALNAVFAAEGKRVAHQNLIMATTSTVGEPTPASLRVARQEALDASLPILDGTRGQQVVSDYQAIIDDFQSSGWHGLQMSNREKHCQCFRILRGQGDA